MQVKIIMATELIIHHNFFWTESKRILRAHDTASSLLEDAVLYKSNNTRNALSYHSNSIFILENKKKCCYITVP